MSVKSRLSYQRCLHLWMLWRDEMKKSRELSFTSVSIRRAQEMRETIFFTLNQRHEGMCKCLFIYLFFSCSVMMQKREPTAYSKQLLFFRKYLELSINLIFAIEKSIRVTRSESNYGWNTRFPNSLILQLLKSNPIIWTLIKRLCCAHHIHICISVDIITFANGPFSIFPPLIRGRHQQLVIRRFVLIS